MILSIDTEPGIFYELDKGHAVTKERVTRGLFCLGPEFQLNTMFQMWELHKDGLQVGFFFYSAFKVVNKGGVLLTYMESKKGKAESSRIVVRHPDLVVYDIPGCGSIAITTKVSDSIKSIITEQ